MNSEILSLAEEVASSIEPSTAASPQPLPDPLTLYKTGRILFACRDNSNADPIIDAFDSLLISLGEEYVCSVLHQLHVAYANLIVSVSSNASTPDVSLLREFMAHVPNYAMKTVICSPKDLTEATESLCGIYLSKTACLHCANLKSEEANNELDIVLASFFWAYDYLLLDETIDLKKDVLGAISCILIGVVDSIFCDDSEDEQLGNIMNILQRIQTSDSCAMGDMLQAEQIEHSFVNVLTAKFADGAQLQYILAMLRAFPRSDSKPVDKQSESKAKWQEEAIPLRQPEQTMTDLQIARIKGVLPDLGEGFIEEALKCYNNDVERTLDALLQQSLHPRLSSLPKNLPRKLKDLPDRYTANVDMHRGATVKEDGKEHVERQKQYIKNVERQAEEEAYLVENVSRALGGLKVQEAKHTDDFDVICDEYDDDYDDQYDGIGDDGGMAGGIGGMDEGLYDVDVHNVHQKYDRGSAKKEQEMWRQYNKLIKDVDAESQFWVSSYDDSVHVILLICICLWFSILNIISFCVMKEESRNLNRQNIKPNKNNTHEQNEEEDMYDDDNGEKKYRGPDKGRGGRLIGPDGKYLPIKRGGKKGRGNGAAPSEENNNSGRGGRGGGRGRGGAGRGTSGKANQEGQAKEGGDLSKIQKRRKNDNKAKIGNHHRKDRATKKATGGMMH